MYRLEEVRNKKITTAGFAEYTLKPYRVGDQLLEDSQQDDQQLDDQLLDDSQQDDQQLHDQQLDDAQKKPVKTEVVNIHCDCLMPEDGKKAMVLCGKCSQWYHQTCHLVAEYVFY